MQIVTPRLILREFKESDFDALRDIDSRPEMHTFEKELPGVEETRQSLDTYIRDALDLPRVHHQLAITIQPADTARGIVKLSRQWQAIREWEVGWAIHPEEWGRGYATEAAKYLINWGFTALNIHRIVAYCHVDNLPSVRVMEKLGMHRDGRLRETRWLHGVWWDELVYSILDREWKGL